MTAGPRILYVIGQLSRGGAEQQFYYLLKYLRPEAKVISLREGGYWADPIRELGYEVIELKRHGRADISRLLAIMRVIRTYRPDIIHLFMDNMYGLYGRLAALLSGHTRMIVGERAHPAFDPPWYKLLRLYILNHFVVAVVANSQAARVYLVDEMGLPERKAFFIPNGLEIERIVAESRVLTDAMPAEFAGHPIIGTVGDLSPRKAPDVFLRVAKRVHEVLPTARFVHVGEGVLREEALEMRAALCLQDVVWFAGHRTDIPRWLGAMDVFVLTSRFEGTPNVVMEAMVVGLPCVVTDVGGCRELVQDGETGYIVPVGDEEGLAERIQKLIADAELRARLGAQGREAVEAYDVEAMAERYSQLYEMAARA